MTDLQTPNPPLQKQSRKEQILQTLASMLEAMPGGRITTAQLAKSVGVSEAALYRHFPSKAKMFEALIEFIEETIFTRISLITQEHNEATKQIELILSMIVTFCDRNPGICRIMTGDAIVGEQERLQKRVEQLYERIETQIKQIFRKSEAAQLSFTIISTTDSAALLTSFLEGKIFQFVRSRFKKSPLIGWDEQITFLLSTLIATPQENRQPPLNYT